MSERPDTRHPRPTLRIDGPATIRVNRRVTLIISAAEDAAVTREDDRPHRKDSPLDRRPPPGQ